jgi:hypothetical protein
MTTEEWRAVWRRTTAPVWGMCETCCDDASLTECPYEAELMVCADCLSHIESEYEAHLIYDL